MKIRSHVPITVYMTDGNGTNFFSKRLYEWNDGTWYSDANYSATEVERRLAAVTGHDHQVVVPYHNDPFDGTGHVDMLSKIISPTKVLVSSTPKGAPNYDLLEQAAAVYRAARNADGERFEVIRVPMRFAGKSPYSYTNSFLVNGYALVPVYGRAEDTGALAIYRAQLPGYTVVGIDAQRSIKSGGTIHCLTQVLPAAQRELTIGRPVDARVERGAATYLYFKAIKGRTYHVTVIDQYNMSYYSKNYGLRAAWFNVLRRDRWTQYPTTVYGSVKSGGGVTPSSSAPAATLTALDNVVVLKVEGFRREDYSGSFGVEINE